MGRWIVINMSTYHSYTNQTSKEYWQEHKTRNAQIESVALFEDYRISLEKQVYATVNELFQTETIVRERVQDKLTLM